MGREVLSIEVGPRVRSVAAKMGLQVVELLDSPLAQRPELFPDGVHPSAAGASAIAALIGQRLLEVWATREDESEGDAREQAHEPDGVVEHGDAAAGCAGEKSEKVEFERQVVLRELHKLKTMQGF